MLCKLSHSRSVIQCIALLDIIAKLRHSNNTAIGSQVCFMPTQSSYEQSQQSLWGTNKVAWGTRPTEAVMFCPLLSKQIGYLSLKVTDPPTLPLAHSLYVILRFFNSLLKTIQLFADFVIIQYQL